MGAISAGANQKNDRASDITGTTAPVNEPTYGGPVPKYGQPTVPVQQTYQPGYAQTTGIAPSSANISEMDGSHAGTMTSSTYGNQNPNPYSELHGAGYAR